MPPQITSDKYPELAEVANRLLAEHEQEVRQVVVAIASFDRIYGRQPMTTYETGCLCAGNYCDAPFLHGLRLDGQSITELQTKWKAGRA